MTRNALARVSVRTSEKRHTKQIRIRATAHFSTASFLLAYCLVGVVSTFQPVFMHIYFLTLAVTFTME